MIRSAQNLMITAGITFGGMFSPYAFSQSQDPCTERAWYTDTLEHCTDANPDDVIVLGSVQVLHSAYGKRVVLHDDKRGDIELLLTKSLVQTVDEYPADSYEAEGTLTNGQMIVKSLRPIE